MAEGKEAWQGHLDPNVIWQSDPNCWVITTVEADESSVTINSQNTTTIQLLVAINKTEELRAVNSSVNFSYNKKFFVKDSCVEI